VGGLRKAMILTSLQLVLTEEKPCFHEQSVVFDGCARNACKLRRPRPSPRQNADCDDPGACANKNALIRGFGVLERVQYGSVQYMLIMSETTSAEQF